MVRIRLRRMGAKKKPFYRIVVADKRSPRDGRFIETIGTYNPLTEPETIDIQLDRAAHWLSVGAQPTAAVARILRDRNILDGEGKLIALPEGADETASTDEAAESNLLESAAVGVMGATADALDAAADAVEGIATEAAG